MTDDDYPYRSPPDAKTWQPQWPPDTSPATPPVLIPAFALSLAVPIGGVMLVLSLGNALLVPLGALLDGPGTPGFLPGSFCMFALAGSIGAQAALLAILAVFGSGPLWRRLAWHWGLAAIALFAWSVGYTVEYADLRGWGMDGEIYLAAVLGLPLVALSCQAPLWLLRIYFDWRIHSSDQAFATEPPRPLAIRDFLAGTVLVALTMTANRLGKPDPIADLVYWTGWSIGSVAAAAITLAVVVPVLVFMLGLRDWRLGALGTLLAAAIMSATLAIGVICLVPSGGPSPKLWTFFSVALTSGVVGTLAATLGLLRWYGFRLATRRTDF
jgi:hypothetical protein